MPILGVSLHILVALYFAVHAIRSGQNMYWLLILFSFPLLGSVVYFFAIYLPGSRLQHSAGKALALAAKALDPTKELREARAAFEFTPTAQNQMRLASALLEAGEAQEAAQAYETCLAGPFAADLDIRWGAARAFLACGRGAQALVHARFIRENDNNFRAEAISVIMAQAHQAAGEKSAAKAEFDNSLTRFGSVEYKAEYLIWALSVGELGLAERLQADIDKDMSRWTRHHQAANAPLLKRIKQAQRQQS